MTAFGVIIWLVIIVAIARAVRHRQLRGRAHAGEAIEADRDGGPFEDASPPHGEDASPQQHAAEAAAADPGSPRWLAEPLAPLLQNLGHPADLLAEPDFDDAATELAEGDIATRQLLAYASGDNALLWYLCVEAVARRGADAAIMPDLLRMLGMRYGWRAYFALRAIHAHAAEPVLGLVLSRLDWNWTVDPERGWLAEFVGWRAGAGEQPTLGPGRAALDALPAEAREGLDQVVQQLVDVLPAGVFQEYQAWQGDRTDLRFLQSVGTIVGMAGDDAATDLVDHPALAAATATAAALLRRDRPRPVVVVGEPGVGKSAVVARLAAGFGTEGWTVFRCSAPELLSGQIFVGQMEDRIQRVVRELEYRRVLWIVPEFHELFYSGRTLQNPSGLLDQLFPYLERGSLRLVGETSPMAWEKVLQQRPRLRGLVEPVRVDPLDATAAAAITTEWAAARGFPEAVRQEAHLLAAQHLSGSHAPGNVMTLLRLTAERAAARGGGTQVERDDMLAALTGLTGLPRDVLDDRTALDLDHVRDFFASRVVGQDEAVGALLERIALLKAGLTDPGRPQGVFLFVGPSGTGKTELAKTLAEYLFGSPDRMIRLDMSELQDPAMGYRLTGSRNDLDAGSSLVDEVRRQPFSVVLLDEIEKAHPRIHDLFLQLFDDGRLTDQNGNTASFRNAIMIMTSNLGSEIRSGGIGFNPADGAPTHPSVQRSVEQAFRPEFINRIDRIICFRPLDRTVIRRLLDKEIREVLGRRGLRDRAWALEWEESAIEFLLQQGFTPALGARPLKRAVERYLLSPLAIGIAGRKFPEGDQFLYIRAAGDRLAVEFIDPDEGHAESLPPVSLPSDEVPALEDIVRDARGDAAEVEALQAEYEHLRDTLAGDAWRERKQKALGDMAAPDFWSSTRRYAVLGLAEYMDRIEVGFQTAGSLLRRVHRGTQGNGTRFTPHLVGRLAQQLYLVGEALDGIAAGLPRDAFLRITATHDPGTDPVRTDDFARRIDRMYRSWAERRGMRFQVLAETVSDPYCATLAVSGFAAYPILAPEHGLHVLESPARGRTFARLRTCVIVAPQPDEPPSGASTLLAQARLSLEAAGAAADVVRRYREEPSPLVRDRVRGWRTGRIDQVLDGDFDLVG
jgi:ATP-dependent Clp protease ATP-binding subunit ClpC